MLRLTSIGFQSNVKNIVPHHRDTERKEEAQRKTFNPLCNLRVLRVSVVNGSFLTLK